MALTRAEAKALREELKAWKIKRYSHGYPQLPPNIACPHCGRVDEHVSLGSSSSLGDHSGFYWRTRRCRCRGGFTVAISKDSEIKILPVMKTSIQLHNEELEAHAAARKEAEAAIAAATETALQPRSPEPGTEPTPEAPSALTGLAEPEKQQEPEPEPEPEPPAELNVVPPETLTQWAQEDLANETDPE